MTGIGIVGTVICTAFSLKGLLPDLIGTTAFIAIVVWIWGAIRMVMKRKRA